MIDPKIDMASIKTGVLETFRTIYDEIERNRNLSRANNEEYVVPDDFKMAEHYDLFLKHQDLCKEFSNLTHPQVKGNVLNEEQCQTFFIKRLHQYTQQAYLDSLVATATKPTSQFATQQVPRSAGNKTIIRTLKKELKQQEEQLEALQAVDEEINYLKTLGSQIQALDTAITKYPNQFVAVSKDGQPLLPIRSQHMQVLIDILNDRNFTKYELYKDKDLMRLLQQIFKQEFQNLVMQCFYPADNPLAKDITSNPQDLDIVKAAERAKRTLHLCAALVLNFCEANDIQAYHQNKNLLTALTEAYKAFLETTFKNNPRSTLEGFVQQQIQSQSSPKSFNEKVVKDPYMLRKLPLLLSLTVAAINNAAANNLAKKPAAAGALPSGSAPTNPAALPRRTARKSSQPSGETPSRAAGASTSKPYSTNLNSVL